MYVSGPTNVVRLECSTGSIKKIIYLFMDYHIDAAYQTKCTDPRSVDVKTFFLEEFDRQRKESPDKTFDFMFERGPLDPYHQRDRKGIYIDEVADMFTEAFQISATSGKVVKSTLVPNVRFHLVDVRDFAIRKSMNAYFGPISKIFRQIYANKGFNTTQLHTLSEQLQIIQSEYAGLYVNMYQNHNLFNPKPNNVVYSPYENRMHNISATDNYVLTQKFIYKILTNYDNPSVKKIINGIIQTELLDMFIDFFAWLDLALSQIHEIIFEANRYESDTDRILFQHSDQSYAYGPDPIRYLKIILELSDMKSILYDKLIFIGLYLMDLYALRRTLDKNYITNMIAYTGAAHSKNYIRLLIKYGQATLTHWSYLKYNLKKTTQMVKSSTKFNDLTVLFVPQTKTQCVNLKLFPKLFY